MTRGISGFERLRLFWIAPIVGAVVAGMTCRSVFEEK